MLSSSIRLISLASSLLLVAGCAEVNSGVRDRFPAAFNAPSVRSDFEDLLDFGANMANMPTSARTETCRSLVKHQKDLPDRGIVLQLMIGRLLSDACGDIPKILDELAGIPPDSLGDDRTQRLVLIHTEALKRINSTTKKLGSLERKQKTVQTVLDSKDTNGSKKKESQLLREKLEAIRSMEKQLDETSDGK